jgi:hypothetical protein
MQKQVFVSKPKAGGEFSFNNTKENPLEKIQKPHVFREKEKMLIKIKPA